jgi:transposase
LFWQLALAVERGAAAILHWSWWRRWHQAWARYYHYRRRQSAATECEQPKGAARHAQAQQMDVIDVVWRRLEPLLPPAHRVGHPYDYDRRLMLDAIVHVMQTDCGWRNLPSRFPPWQTVYTQLTQWRKTGIWGTIWFGLAQPGLTDELQL